jgi:hypothetical protein
MTTMQNNENDCIRNGLISVGDGLFYGVLDCAGREIPRSKSEWIVLNNLELG